MRPLVNKRTEAFTLLLACFVALIPFNNIYEVVAMMSGNLSSWTEVLTPIYIKAFKDVFLVVCILMMVLTCLKEPRRVKVFWTKPFLILNVFLVLLLLDSLYSFSFMPADIVLMGIRGYWSILFIYVGALYCDFSKRKIYRIILVVFWFHLLVQLFQFSTNAGYSVYFERRSPGLFMVPATAGAFSLLIHYFGVEFKSNLVKLASLGSLWLCNSTTGLLFLIAYYLYSYRNKFRPKIVYYPMFAMVITLIGYIMFTHIGEITGRGSGASDSALVRLGLLYFAFINWKGLLLMGKGMGIATSQAYLSGYSGAVIADNTYLGIIYNMGIVPAILMLGFIVRSYRHFENKLLFCTLLGYSMTTVIFEINPIIQIILILLGAHIGRSYAMDERIKTGTISANCTVLSRS